MLNSRGAEIICSGLWDRSIMTPIVPYPQEGAHHGHDPPRLDADGKAVLSGRRARWLRPASDRSPPAGQAPRRAGAQRGMVRLPDGRLRAVAALRAGWSRTGRAPTAPPRRPVGAVAAIARP